MMAMTTSSSISVNPRRARAGLGGWGLEFTALGFNRFAPAAPGAQPPIRKSPLACAPPWVTFAPMLSLSKPEVILTHESDLDGFVSGLLLQRLALKVFGEKPPMEAFHNHMWRQRRMSEGAAWVADMSFERRLDRPCWMVVDHHPTDQAATQALLIHDTAKSAGLIAYELCGQHGIQTPALDRLVHLNNVADLFLADDPDFEVATDYANLVKNYQFWNLHAILEGDLERLLGHPLVEVMAVKRRVENPIGYDYSRKHVVPISSEIGYVESVVGNVNWIVHQLLERGDTPFQVLLTLIRKSNGLVIASLRSRNGEAVKIASILNGGGHPNACGATLPRGVQTIPDALDYLRRLLAPGTHVESAAETEDLERAFLAALK